MRLPSYLILGGTGSYACQRWETAKVSLDKIPFWVDDETTVDGFRVVPGWMHCTIYKDPSASALYSNGFYTVSTSTSGSHIWRNNYPLVLLHFSDKDKYEAYKKLWTDASQHQRQFFCYHDGTAFTVAQALNYCDKRQEIAILELERNWGSLAYQDDLLGVDRISVFFVSDNDYNRLLQVPYGYKGNYIFCGVGTSVQKNNKVYINTAIVNKNLFKASVGGGQAAYVKVYWDGTSLKVTADSTTQASVSWPSTKDSFGVYVSPSGNWIVDEIYEPYGIYKLKEN